MLFGKKNEHESKIRVYHWINLFVQPFFFCIERVSGLSVGTFKQRNGLDFWDAWKFQKFPKFFLEGLPR
jgi:hypothetical protein